MTKDPLGQKSQPGIGEDLTLPELNQDYWIVHPAHIYIYIYIYKGKVIQLQARFGPEDG